MAGAVTHTWPKAVRAAIVTAVVDHGLSQNKAVKAAQAGELPNCPTLGDHKPGRSTVAQWVQAEENRRNREAAEIVDTTGLFNAAEQALAKLLTRVIEDSQLAAQGKAGNLTDQDAARIRRNIGVLKAACPEAGRRTRATPQPTPQNGTRKKADGDGTTPSDLASRLAARAASPPKTTTPQRETGTVGTQQTEDQHAQGSGSDSVSRTHAEPEPVPA